MTKMTTKDRRRYDPVRIFMIEPQKSQLILSTSRAGPNLMEILNCQLCKKTFEVILLGISVHIILCEMAALGLEHINTTPKDAFLYRYQILGSCLMIGTAFLGYVVMICFVINWIERKPKIEIYDFIKYYSTRNDEPSSTPWYQRKLFVKITVVICLVFIWLAMFEIGHTFYVIAQSIEDKPLMDWSRFNVYVMISGPLFLIWLMILGAVSFVLITECIVEINHSYGSTMSRQHMN